jgi:YidC/Oxa1 family membrane protein insertase
MNPNMNNGGMQKRMLVMTLVVFAFFLAYEFLVLKPQQEAKLKEQAAQTQNVSNTANQAPVQEAQAPALGTPTAIQAPDSNAIASKNIASVIKTNKSIYEIDTLGRIAQVTLQESKYINEDLNQIKLFDANQLRPLEVRFSDVNVNDEAFKVNVVANQSQIDATQEKQVLVLTQNLSMTTVTKTLTFYPDGHYDVTVSTSTPQSFFYVNRISTECFSRYVCRPWSIIKTQ